MLIDSKNLKINRSSQTLHNVFDDHSGDAIYYVSTIDDINDAIKRAGASPAPTIDDIDLAFFAVNENHSSENKYTINHKNQINHENHSSDNTHTINHKNQINHKNHSSDNTYTQSII
jgi:hypothetical protein